MACASLCHFGINWRRPSVCVLTGIVLFASGVLFAVLIAIPALGYWLFGLNEILAFWFAYILTRPLGASFADWTGKAHSVGGLALGDGPVSLVLVLLIIGFVGYLTVTRKDTKSA